MAGLVYAREYPVGAIPQEGPLRFGLPLLVIIAVVAGARFPRARTYAHLGALAVFGLSSVWSLEAFAMTSATLAAVVGAEVVITAPGQRTARLKRWLLGAILACAGAHAVLALGTLAASGELPDWGRYVAFLHTFFAGDQSDITYDFARFSPALAVAAGYLIAAAAVVLFVRERPDLARREPATVLALVGASAYGIALFYYFVNRSAPHVLAYVCLPLLLTSTIWVGLLLRSRDFLPRALLTGTIAFAFAVSALLVAVAWSSIGPRFERSALAHAPPGGSGLRAALERLWDFPPISPQTPAGERMLARYLPGEDRSVVLVQPSTLTELLMRSGRSNRLPLANPVEDGFAPEASLPVLRASVHEQLEDGDRLLLDDAALAVVREDPDSEVSRRYALGAATTPLQVEVLREIDRRFLLRPRVRRDGFVVVELEARS